MPRTTWSESAGFGQGEPFICKENNAINTFEQMANKVTMVTINFTRSNPKNFIALFKARLSVSINYF